MDKVYQIYDRAYAQMFANEELFRELIESFVHEPWVKDIDFSKSERVNKSFVAEDYAKTESDVIYKLKLNNEKEVFVYVLLEFQSSVDKFMPVRCLNYITNLYLDLIKERGETILLPPVFPLVLYNGDEKWTHSNKLSDFIKDRDILGEYGIDFQMFLLKENEYSLEELLKLGNIVSTLFITEAHYDLEIIQQQVFKILETTGITMGLKLFLNYFHQMSLNEKVEILDYNKIQELYKTKEDVNSMFLTAIRKEKENIRMEGEQIGIAKGEIKALKNKSIKLLSKKFGELPQYLINKINNTQSIEKIDQIIDNIFDFNSLTEVEHIFKNIE